MQKGNIVLHHIRTQDKLTDIVTKFLSKSTQKHLVKLINNFVSQQKRKQRSPILKKGNASSPQDQQTIVIFRGSNEEIIQSRCEDYLEALAV